MSGLDAARLRREETAAGFAATGLKKGKNGGVDGTRTRGLRRDRPEHGCFGLRRVSRGITAKLL